MKKSKAYYICGFILLLISICIGVFGLTMPLLDQTKTYLGWIGFGVAFFSIILLFFSIFLIYKAKYLKNNKK